MKVLIIYSHPNREKSHSSIILEEIESNLKAKNVSYEVIDLYKINYDPVLKDKELYSAGRKFIAKQNLEFQDKIKKADFIIFIYPMWWSSMPAILKGFFDRVFTPDFAFRFEKGIPIKLLKGKRAIVFSTMGAYRIFSFLSGDRASNLIKKSVLEFCGIKTKVYQMGHVTKLDDNQIKKVRDTVRKGLNYLCKKTYNF